MNMIKQDKAFIKKITGKVGKAIQKFDLVKEGDKILIGVSGGKDSLILLETLANISKASLVNFKIFAVHINAVNLPYAIDQPYIEAMCERLGVEFLMKDITVDFKSDDPNIKEKNNCFMCSWFRRKTLFALAEEHGCNKIALGHHMDDAVQTLLMNMSFQGSISSFPPKLSMFDGKIEIIRPMILIPEKNLIRFAKIKEFVLEKELCPHEDESSRKDIRGIVKQLNEFYPHAVNNIYASMSNVQDEYLPGK